MIIGMKLLVLVGNGYINMKCKTENENNIQSGEKSLAAQILPHVFIAFSWIDIALIAAPTQLLIEES